MATLEELGFEPIEDSSLDDLGFEELPKEKSGIENALNTVEGAAIGAAQGFTFGFGDEIAAAAKTAVDTPSLDYKDGLTALLDRYRQNVKSTRDYIKQVEEESPNAFLTGNIVGGIASPVNKIGAVTKGAGVLKNALAASKVGAVAGLGTSEGENLGDIALDTLTGAGLGFATPLALKGIEKGSKGAGKLAKTVHDKLRDKVDVYDDTIKALEYGSRGIETAGKEVMKDLVEKTRKNITDPLVDFVSGERKKAGSLIELFRNEAADMGYKIPMESNLDDMMTSIKKVTSKEDRELLTNRLKELMKFNKDTKLVPGKVVTGKASLSPEQKAIEELTEQRDAILARNKELGMNSELGPIKLDQTNKTALFADVTDEGGRVISRPIKGDAPFSTLDEVVENTTPSPMDNKELQVLGQEMGFLKSKVGPEAEHVARTIENRARDLSKQAIGDEMIGPFTSANQDYSTTARIFDRLDDNLIKGHQVEKEKAVSKVDDLFRNTGGDSDTAIKKKQILDNTVKDLEKLDPTFANQIKSKVDELGDMWDLNKKSRREGLSGFGSAVSSVGIKGGEAAGLASRGIKNIVSAGKKYVATNTPEAIKDLANKMSIKGNTKFSTLLNNIADKPERTRNALIFSLMQRPDFRQAVAENEDGTK